MKNLLKKYNLSLPIVKTIDAFCLFLYKEYKKYFFINFTFFKKNYHLK